MNDKEFLTWIHERLEHVYGENNNADFMHRLRNLISKIPDKIHNIKTNI